VAEHLLSREGTGGAWELKSTMCVKVMRVLLCRYAKTCLYGHGIAHGGMIFALADTAFAYACNSRNVSTVAQQASMCSLPGA